jgi:choice-of-anchor B domain-containing protein
VLLVSGNELLVGESQFQSRPGYVYVYRRDGTGPWREVGRLEASDAVANDHFGRALALAEGDLLVGATISRESGALYVFAKAADGTWREAASMVPSDATVEGSFGRVAATDGRTVVMSDWAAGESRGAVYVFEKRDGAWRETARLSASDAEPNDWFGYAVDVEGDRIVVSARNKARSRGAVYTFVRSGSGWRETARVLPPDTVPNVQFGAAVAIVGDRIVVGAPGAAQFVGAAYVYRPESGAWTLGETIAPPAGTQPSGSFGWAFAEAGQELWISAPGIESGRIFRMTRAGDGAWQHASVLEGRDVQPGDGFGGAVAVGGPVAAVGAIFDDFQFGSVLTFDQQDGAWAQGTRLASEIDALDPILGGRVDCAQGKATMFDCNEVDVLSFLPVKDIGGSRGVEVNDVWGWTDARTGKEWAIVGRFDGTSFLDVSDPANPVYAGTLPMHEGSRPNTWRDIKVYRDHAYIVADGAGPHGVQVFDLTRLRDTERSATPVTFTEDAHYDRVASAHNIVINEATGFAYAVGVNSGGETCGGGLHMIDIREPKKPTFAGCFQDTETGNQGTGYSHDAQCVTYHGPDETYRGREICLGSNETALSIADVTTKGQPIAISRASYPNVGYAHQGWLDEQHEFFYMNDEGDETSGTVSHTRTLVWDVRDLDDPVLAKEYFGPSTSSDHNLYIVGNMMYQSNYVSGLRIVDITNRSEPREVGFFDTVPWNEDPGFDGSWSNYPFFASGTIVVTSGKEGVFLLRKKTRPVS